MQPGIVRVEDIRGHCEWVNPVNGQRIPLANGTLLHGRFTIETAAASQAALNFANGTGLILMPRTRITVERFSQAPSNLNPETLRDLQADPAPSYADIHLEHGKLFGHSAKLRTDSSLFIHTPQLYADIRGTIFSFEHVEGETLSQVGVYEGQVATVVKTAIDDAKRANLVRSLADIESDLTPLETVIGGGETLTVDTKVRDITLVMDHIQPNEYAQFRAQVDDFAAKIGIGEAALRDAIANAYGGQAQGDGTPSRLTTIQSSTVDTNLGPGFKFVIHTQDDEGYDAVETVVGVEVESGDGTVTTVARKSVDATYYNGGAPETTSYQATTKDVMLADGSYTNTTEVTSTSDGGATTHTYTSSASGNADGTASKTATGIYNDGADTITVDETVNVAFDTDGKLQRTITRTITDTSTGATTTQTFADPVTTLSTISVSANANNQLLLSSTSTDPNTGDPVNTERTTTYSDNGRGKTTTTTTTEDDGTVTEETTTTGFDDEGDFVIEKEVTVTPGNEPPPATPFVVDEDVSIERLDNGGFLRTIRQTFNDGSKTIETFQRQVLDNRTTIETRRFDNDGDGTFDSTTIVKRSILSDGSIVIETDTDGDGLFDQTRTIRRNPDSINPGGDGQDDSDIDDAIDDAIDNLDDDVNASN